MCIVACGCTRGACWHGSVRPGWGYGDNTDNNTNTDNNNNNSNIIIIIMIIIIMITHITTIIIIILIIVESAATLLPKTPDASVEGLKRILDLVGPWRSNIRSLALFVRNRDSGTSSTKIVSTKMAARGPYYELLRSPEVQTSTCARAGKRKW